MRSELKLHRVVSGILVLLLAAFVLLLLRLHPSLVDERLETIASLVLVVAAAAALVTMGMVEETIAFQFGRRHKRELLSYLVLGLISIASGLYLAISQTASLQTVGFFTAPFALLFGLAELRIASHLRHHPGYRRAILSGGLVELGMGVALLFGSRLSNESTAILLGYLAVLSILQLLPFVFFWRRSTPHGGIGRDPNRAEREAP
ncbi:MAG TPA: DUF308 domain-containing protein [Acidobacteriaceae bacterium]|nr:DUF308 domain-containing protein [Acidobacteriaceae bacterium]